MDHSIKDANHSRLVELLKKHKLPTQGITITMLGATLSGKSTLCKAIIVDFFQKYYPRTLYLTFSCSSQSKALNELKTASKNYFPIVNGGPQKDILNFVYQEIQKFQREVKDPNIDDGGPGTEAKMGAVILLDDMREKDSRGGVVEQLMLHKRNANFSTILTSHDRALSTTKMRGNVLVAILLRFNNAEGVRRVCTTYLVDKMDDVSKGERFQILLELYRDITVKRYGFIFCYAMDAPIAIYGGQKWDLQKLYDTFIIYAMAQREEKKAKAAESLRKLRNGLVDVETIAKESVQKREEEEQELYIPPDDNDLDEKDDMEEEEEREGEGDEYEEKEEEVF